MTMLWFVAAQLAMPSAESMTLARRLAEQGGVMDAVADELADELAELAAEPEAQALTTRQRQALQDTGERIFAEIRERVLLGVSTTYARNLSIADLRALVTAGDRPEAMRLRKLHPRAVMMAALMVGPVGLKRRTAADYCARTRLLCARAAAD